MSSTNKTAELQLSQFIGTDIPSILTDYNGDMQKIDAGVREVKQATAGAVSDLSSVTARVTNAEQSISGLNSTVQEIATRVVGAEGDIDALQTSVGNLETAVNTKADASAVTALQNDVDNIEAVVPSTASTENPLATMADVGGVSGNEEVLLSLTPESGEKMGAILNRFLSHMPGNLPPYSQLIIKLGDRIFRPDETNISSWGCFRLYNGELDIQQIQLMVGQSKLWALSSDTTQTPVINKDDFTDLSAKKISLVRIYATN